MSDPGYGVVWGEWAVLYLRVAVGGVHCCGRSIINNPRHGGRSGDPEKTDAEARSWIEQLDV